MSEPKRKKRVSYEVKARYEKKAYDRLTILVKKGEKERLQALAASQGMSFNAYLRHCIGSELPSDSKTE